MDRIERTAHRGFCWTAKLWLTAGHLASTFDDMTTKQGGRMKRLMMIAVVCLVGCGDVDDKGGGGDVEKNPEALCEAAKEADRLNAEEKGADGVCHACFEREPDGPNTCMGEGYWDAREGGAEFVNVPGNMLCSDVPTFTEQNCAE